MYANLDGVMHEDVGYIRVVPFVFVFNTGRIKLDLKNFISSFSVMW